MRCDHEWAPADPIPRCLRCGAQPTCSPSQVETWDLCRRKWAYSRRSRRESTEAAKYGDRCHDLLEKYGKTAELPPETPEGRTVLSILGHAPAPGTALHEHRVTATLGGVPWDMRLDFVDAYIPGVLVSIGDLKTTGDFRYVKTREHLERLDPQAIVYGYWAVERFGVPMVVGRWLYGLRVGGKRKPPPGRVVAWSLTREQVTTAFAPFAAKAYSMAWARLLDRTPEAFPRSLGEPCDAFGGCPYKKECHVGVSSLDVAATTLYTIRGAT